MLVAFVVDVVIGRLRRDAEAGALADHLLIAVPEALRPHEGLVIETGRQHARDAVVERPDIELDARPAIDAGSFEAIEQFDLRGAQIGLARSTLAQLHQGVGLFHAGGIDAARAMKFKTPSDQAHTVGEQGRRQGIAGETLIGFAVEAEAEALAAVDAGAGIEALALAFHAPLPPPRGSPIG